MNMTTNIIGFTGRAAAGKDTVCNYIVEYLKTKNKMAVKIACADPLKELCADIFGRALQVPRKAFFGNQVEKEMFLRAVPGWSGRKILQYIGTEGFRHVSPTIWADYMIGHANHTLDTGADIVLVSDVRFLSEANAIHKAGGLVVRVKRPEADSVISSHQSETELLNIQEDYILDNQGRELYLLEKLIEEFLCKLNF